MYKLTNLEPCEKDGIDGWSYTIVYKEVSVKCWRAGDLQEVGKHIDKVLARYNTTVRDFIKSLKRGYIKL